MRILIGTLLQFSEANTNIMSPKIVETFLIHVKNNAQLFKVLLCKKESTQFKEKLAEATVSQLSKPLRFSIQNELMPYVFSFLLDGCSAILIDWINTGFKEDSEDISKLLNFVKA